VGRLDVDEVDVDPVDAGHELRQRVQFGLAAAPVVLGRPIAHELLQRRQLHTLRGICDELLGRPTRQGDAAAQLGELLVRNVDMEWADAGVLGRRAWPHGQRSGLGHCRLLPSPQRTTRRTTHRSPGTCHAAAVSTQCMPAQVWFAPAGARIGQWPVQLASRGLAASRGSSCGVQTRRLHDGAAGAGGAARPEGAVPVVRSFHPRAREPVPALRAVRHGHQAPHRGFDNLWYLLDGSASTGPDGSIERARLPKGALLALRTGRGPGTPRGSAPRA
jgi:hypothetical protein